MSSVIVTDTGFAPDTFCGTWIDMPAETDVETLRVNLDTTDALRIAFTSFADGRGFTLAARLRRIGFTGRLRAKGHVLADQYAMARRSGFDEVEIDAALAARQPEEQWLARANWKNHDYRQQLGRRS